MAPNKKQASFAGGEVAPALWNQTDLAKHQIGARSLKNCFVHVEGGASNRPGTRYALEIGEKGKFIPFEFNDTQTYQLFFYENRVMFLQGGQVVVESINTGADFLKWWQYISTPEEYYLFPNDQDVSDYYEPKAVYMDGSEMVRGTAGSLAVGEWDWAEVTGGKYAIFVRMPGNVDPETLDDGYVERPYVVDSPYAVADLGYVRFSQEYDTLILTCQGYEQRKLVRYGNTDWRFEDLKTQGGPMGALNFDSTRRLTATPEQYRADREYDTGDIVLFTPVYSVTVSWIGTYFGMSNDDVVSADNPTGFDAQWDAYYKDSDVLEQGPGYIKDLITYPRTFIQISKGSGITSGMVVDFSLTFNETGGALNYANAGIVHQVGTGDVYDYLCVGLGWTFHFVTFTGIVPKDSFPAGSDCPSLPSGHNWPEVGVHLQGVEEEQQALLLSVLIDSSNNTIAGAVVDPVLGNLTFMVDLVSDPASYFIAKVPVSGRSPSELPSAWGSYLSVPTEYGNVEIRAKDFQPFSEESIGQIIGFYNNQSDPTKSWADLVPDVLSGTEYIPFGWFKLYGGLTLWTEGKWTGTVYLEQSTNPSQGNWETIGSIASLDQDHNGTFGREIVDLGVTLRVRYVTGRRYASYQSTDGLRLYLREDSTYTNYAEIVYYVSPAVVVGKMQSGDTERMTTDLWGFGEFGGGNGHPVSNTIFQERLLYAGTLAKPKTVWGSRIQNYVNFATSNLQLATEPLALDVSLSKQYEIRHMIPLKSLLILTSGSWHSLAGSDGGLTPTNGEMTIHGYGGVSATVAPLVIGLSILMIGDDDRSVSELRYSLASDGYDRSELDVMAKHLFHGKTVNSWANQEDPYRLVWVVMSDGTGLTFTFLREQQVWAWTPIDTNGLFLEVGSNKSSAGAGADDEVYFLTERVINSETRYFLEYLTPRLPNNDRTLGVFMDCSISYDGAPATVIRGLEHLEGEDVSVLADGAVIEDLTVENGEIELPEEASVVHVGLGYTSRLHTLPLELAEGMSSFGRKGRLTKVAVQVEDSAGFKMGPSVEDLTKISDWADLGANELYSGELWNPVAGDWRTVKDLVIQQTDPLPMTIQTVTPFMELGD